MNARSDNGVVLPDGRAASALLLDCLQEASKAFPDAFGGIALPTDSAAFRTAYPEALPAFEAARLVSPDRFSIARTLAEAVTRQIRWRDADGECALSDWLAGQADAMPLPLETHVYKGARGWRATPVYRGERYGPDRLAALGSLLAQRSVVTPEAGVALERLASEAFSGGTLDLSGRRIAVLGAGAEMAPTRHWLEAGADVLWLDVAPPPADWFESDRFSGTLRWSEAPADLLRAPERVLATLRAFAAAGPIDLGLYAYAPGQARELRLTAAMNAIVDAMGANALASVTMLVSPTTPTARSAEEDAWVERRLMARPLWEAGLSGIGLLGRGEGCARATERSGQGATRTVVSIQGASYQAAQYLGKVLVAESWASVGAHGAQTPVPLRVSANTAAITRTRSLDHPVFAAAFGGAGAFGVETFTPRQSRAINGLLAVADWLAADLPVPGDVRVHGGIHTLPFPLEPALRMAATFGFARDPRLLRGLLPG